MSRYIDADAARAMVAPICDDDKNNVCTIETAKRLILKVLDTSETVDAIPVVHGHWEITDAYPHNVYCSVCHKRYAQTHWKVWEDGTLPRNYCPNCMAKMDEVTE